MSRSWLGLRDHAKRRSRSVAKGDSGIRRRLMMRMRGGAVMRRQYGPAGGHLQYRAFALSSRRGSLRRKSMKSSRPATAKRRRANSSTVHRHTHTSQRRGVYCRDDAVDPCAVGDAALRFEVSRSRVHGRVCPAPLDGGRSSLFIAMPAWRARVVLASHPALLIDLFAILPFYLSHFFSSTSGCFGR